MFRWNVLIFPIISQMRGLQRVIEFAELVRHFFQKFHKCWLTSSSSSFSSSEIHRKHNFKNVSKSQSIRRLRWWIRNDCHLSHVRVGAERAARIARRATWRAKRATRTKRYQRKTSEEPFHNKFLFHLILKFKIFRLDVRSPFAVLTYDHFLRSYEQLASWFMIMIWEFSAREFDNSSPGKK